MPEYRVPHKSNLYLPRVQYFYYKEYSMQKHNRCEGLQHEHVFFSFLIWYGSYVSNKKIEHWLYHQKANFDKQIRRCRQTQEGVSPDLRMTCCAEPPCSPRLPALGWCPQHPSQLHGHIPATHSQQTQYWHSHLLAGRELFKTEIHFCSFAINLHFSASLNQIGFGTGWGGTVCQWSALRGTQ